MKRQRFSGACSSHTASWASCAGCSVRALGRPSPSCADIACASTTPRRITSPKLGVTRCSNSDPRNDHNQLCAVTGPVARHPRLVGRSRRRRVECRIVINMVGSESEAGQLVKSPRASTTTASLSSRIDENQLSTLACQHFLDHFCHPGSRGCRGASFCDRLTAMRPARPMDRRNSRSAADPCVHAQRWRCINIRSGLLAALPSFAPVARLRFLMTARRPADLARSVGSQGLVTTSAVESFGVEARRLATGRWSPRGWARRYNQGAGGIVRSEWWTEGSTCALCHRRRRPLHWV
jgi:hypothetical protein